MFPPISEHTLMTALFTVHRQRAVWERCPADW